LDGKFKVHHKMNPAIIKKYISLAILKIMLKQKEITHQFHIKLKILYTMTRLLMRY
jgi:hypothetical protein